MVFCDGAMVLNLVASVMMNGVCCIHSMEEEEKRKREQREALRKAVTVEWQRQRLMEQEQQERLLREQGLDASSVLAHERRRLLIATKAMASQQSSRASVSSRSQASQDSDYYYAKRVEYPIRTNYDEDQNTLPDSTTPRYQFVENNGYAQPAEIQIETRTRSAPSDKTKQNSNRIPLVIGASPSMNSSLFDFGSDSEDEFDEVQLH